VSTRILAVSLKVFASGSLFSAGTLTSSSLISACQTARSGTLCSILRAS
jgi:hypothetical protein